MKSIKLAIAPRPMPPARPPANDVVRLPARRREELAFLPAALEIAETPPSPIGRAIGLTLIVLFCAALAWAWWGSIDIVASATGKIVPSIRTKVVQPFETGVVRSIRVHDGQVVKAGDVLIELDPTANAADRDHLRSDLLAEQLTIARLRTALAGGDDPLADFSPPANADPTLIAVHRQLLVNQVGEHRAKVAAIGRQQAQKEAEQATTAATIHKLETVIPVIQPRVDMRRTLMEKDLGSRIAYLETLQLLVEQQKELGVQKSHLVEAEAAIAAIRETRRQAEAEYRRTLSDELAKSEQKVIGLAQELIKAEQKTNFTRYGLLQGDVLSVSQDAIIRDRRQDRADDRALGTQNDTSEPKGQELNYSARISLVRSQMQIDDRLVNLSPGMAVTVEIKTGSRRILSYLLSPLLRYRQETLRER